MPSGKRARQQRQTAAPPPVRSKGGPRGARQASPRVLAIAGGVVVLVVIAVVLAVVLSKGSANKGGLPANVTVQSALANGLPGTQDVYNLFKGIPQHGNVLGSPSAPVTMVEYIDLQCPFCREFETQVAPSVISKYVRPGKLKVEVRPLAFIGPDSVTGRKALLAAAEQGYAFNFAQLLYDNAQTENTGWLNQSMVQAAALSIPGIDPQTLVARENASSITSEASSFDRQGTADNVNSTPTLLVGKSGGTPTLVNITSPTDQATLFAAIDAALK
jgi:protein-disulfide isomerase